MKHYLVKVSKVVLGATEDADQGELKLFIRRDGDDEGDIEAVKREALAAVRATGVLPGEATVFPLTKEQYETTRILNMSRTKPKPTLQ